MKKIYNDTEIYGKLTLKSQAGGECAFESNSSGNACVELDGNLYTIPHYRVGDIFLSTNSTSPAERFGGTWEMLTGDAYLKIVASKAGSYSGTNSQHKIPVASMPSHTHTLKEFRLTGSRGLQADGAFPAATYPRDNIHENHDMASIFPGKYFALNNTGGGQAYYPYYYGTYAWIKRA